MIKKIVLSGLGILMCTTPLFASADPISDLQAQIQVLLAQITQLKTQTQVGTNSNVRSTALCLRLANNLSINATDATKNGEISKLQQFLAQDPTIYPEGKITGYFGAATLRAVQRWQKVRGIVSSGAPDTTGYGSIGARTRVALAQGCNSTADNTSVSGSVGAASPQVQMQEIIVGTGKEAAPGRKVSVSYVGKFSNGTVFDSSAMHGNQALQFTLGDQGLIQGFQIGVNGMKEGGKRIITVPPSLAYGSNDVKDANGNITIPANSTLIFELMLINVDGGTVSTSTTAPSITVVSPNGNESVKFGSMYTVKWSAQNLPTSANLAFSLIAADGKAYRIKDMVVPAASGSFQWTMNGVACWGTQCAENVMKVGDSFKVRAQIYAPANSCYDNQWSNGVCPSGMVQATVVAEDTSDQPFMVVQ